MSLATTTDPVETVQLILEATDDSDWPAGQKPTHIEQMQETKRSAKLNRDNGADSDAVYVWSPSDGDIRQLGEGNGSGPPDAYEDVQVVSAEVWTPVEGRVAGLSGNLREILLQYWTSNYDGVNWQSIRPVAEGDVRAEHHPRGGNDHYVISTTVRLRADREPA